MSLPVTNDLIGVCDYAQTVLELYLPDALTEINTARDLALVTPKAYYRSEFVPEAFVGFSIGLFPTSIEPTETHDRVKRRVRLTARLRVSAQGVSANTEREFNDSLYAYIDAVTHVLRKHMRASGGQSTAGVTSYVADRVDLSPLLQDPSASVWFAMADVIGTVSQNTRLLE